MSATWETTWDDNTYVDITGAGLIVEFPAAGAAAPIRTDTSAGGKIVGSFTADAVGDELAIGICDSGLAQYYTGANDTLRYFKNSYVDLNGVSQGAGWSTYTVGDRIDVAWDRTANRAWLGKNGTWVGDPVAGTGGIDISGLTGDLFFFAAGSNGAQTTFDPAHSGLGSLSGFGDLGGTAGATGTLAATEGADAASLAGEVIVQGTIAASESGDTASLSGDVLVNGALSAAESGNDTAAVSGAVLVFGSLAATEGQDTASLAGDVIVQGSLAATEEADSAAFTGTGPAPVTGTMAASEGSDTASISGTVQVQGSVSASEDSDTVGFAGLVLIQGGLSASEDADTFSATSLTFVPRRTAGARVFNQSRPAARSQARPGQTISSRPANVSRGTR